MRALLSASFVGAAALAVYAAFSLRRAVTEWVIPEGGMPVRRLRAGAPDLAELTMVGLQFIGVLAFLCLGYRAWRQLSKRQVV